VLSHTQEKIFSQEMPQSFPESCVLFEKFLFVLERFTIENLSFKKLSKRKAYLTNIKVSTCNP